MYNSSMSLKESKKILSSLSILYVEDEENIRNNLTATLEIIFKQVFSVSNVNDALNYYNESKPDIILSDIQLGNQSGIDFVKKIRETNQKIPIILITAHLETEFLLEATKLKLVDYLPKPVKFDTLYEALINATNDIIRQGNLFISFDDGSKFDVQKSMLIKDEKEINLTSSEQKLLKVFLNNLGKTVSYEQIKDYVWDDPYEATDTALKSLLNKLRGKIGKKTIKNVSGIGYFIVTADNN